MRHGFNEQYFEDIQALANSGCYDPYHRDLEVVLDRSRNPEVVSDPALQLEVQGVIFQLIEGRTVAIHHGRRSKNPSYEQFLSNMGSECIVAAYRNIADGMAWQTLGYDQFCIRVLAQAHSPGPLWKKEGRPAELAVAQQGAENGQFVILNDITNLIRVGDVILVDPGADPRDVTIVDTKLRGKKHIKLLDEFHLQEKVKRGGKLTKQETRLLQAQQSINERKLRIGGYVVDVLSVSPQHVPDKLAGVQAAVAEASEQGIYDGFLTPYLHLTVVDLKQPRAKKRMAKLEASIAARAPMETLIESSNYNYIAANTGGNADRNVFPLSLLPFDTPTTVKLLLGEMFIKATVYKEPLDTAFAELGWRFRYDRELMHNFVPPRGNELVTYFSSEELFPAVQWDNQVAGVMELEHHSGRFRTTVFDQILQMDHEFTTAGHIAAYAESVMQNPASRLPGEKFMENLGDRERRRAMRRRRA